MSQHDLDLYGSGINWKRATAIFAVMSVIVAALGFFGYRWLTTVTPVSRDQALQMFKAESRAADRAASANSGRDDAAGTRDEGKERPSDKDDEPGNATSSGSGPGGGGSSPKKHSTTVAAGAAAGEEREGEGKGGGRDSSAQPRGPLERQHGSVQVFSPRVTTGREVVGMRTSGTRQQGFLHRCMKPDHWPSCEARQGVPEIPLRGTRK